MISATNLQTGVSKHLLGRERDAVRNRGSESGTNRHAEVHRSAPQSEHHEGLSHKTEAYSGAASLRGLGSRHRGETPAELLELMIMQMGGGPYSTYKGMHIDLAV